MLLVVTLYVVMCGQPIICNTSEEKHRFSSHTGIVQTIERKSKSKISSMTGSNMITSTLTREFSVADTDVHRSPAEVSLLFSQLAEDWSSKTGHVSSISDLASHPSYKKIIELGWDVVPFLLKDLQENRRFWFPALYAITNVRPFDPSDAGNGKRMTEAWITWGRRKGLI